MVKHGIDSRNVEMLVQIHEVFSQQVADYPGDHKRTDHLLPPDGNHVTVKMKQSLVQEEKQQQGYVGKQHLIAHVCPVHPRKREPVGRIRIRQGNQFRKMREECHHDGDGIHYQQISIIHDLLHPQNQDFWGALRADTYIPGRKSFSGCSTRAYTLMERLVLSTIWSMESKVALKVVPPIPFT